MFMDQGVMIAFDQRIDLFTVLPNPLGGGGGPIHRSCGPIISFHAIGIDTKNNGGNLFVIDVFVIIVFHRIKNIGTGAMTFNKRVINVSSKDIKTRSLDLEPKK